MKKSKHFRKDVILARIIAAVLLIVSIALMVFASSLLSKSPDQDKDSQNTQNSQSAKPGPQDSESESEEGESESEVESETETEIESETESESESESESNTNSEEKLYVKTTTQVKLRKEANTNCATLDRIDGGTVLLVEEVLDGWYKVTYNGQTGYVSADYAKVEETE